MSAPYLQTLQAQTEAVAAAADATIIVGRAPFAGTVTAASYTPEANITGNDAESRAFTVVNKGADGNGTTVVATRDMATGVAATDFNEDALTLSVVEGALDVAEGDILAFTSVHEGATGLADPGGLVKVTIARS
jgi:hypothetical protein